MARPPLLLSALLDRRQAILTLTLFSLIHQPLRNFFFGFGDDSPNLQARVSVNPRERAGTLMIQKCNSRDGPLVNNEQDCEDWER